MIKIGNIVIGKIDIDGKKTTMVGKPMFCGSSPLSPRQHMKYIREINRLRKARTKEEPIVTYGPAQQVIDVINEDMKGE